MKKVRKTALRNKTRAPAPRGCELPRPPSNRVLAKSVLKHSEREARDVRRYFLSQSRNDKIKHLEKVASEPVFGRTYDVWDVWTEKDRWWVITSPLNLYRQKDYVSMDFTLSLHIGLTSRIMARSQPPVDEEEEQRLATAWRRWRQAGDALDRAKEAEDFQAVGMRCRECLLEFVRVAACEEFVPAGQEAPPAGDFVQWTDLIANAMAPGRSGEAVRGYLKTTAKTGWQLVNWLTHAQNAHRLDGVLALEATERVLVTFRISMVRLQRGSPERCPVCASYRLASDFRPDLNPEAPYMTVCESCGWSDRPAPEDERPDRLHS